MKTRNTINLILISFSVFFAGLSLSLLSPFYPSEALSKGVSVTMSGFVMGTVFITTIVVTPLIGMYMDCLGARNFLIVGTFIVGLGNFAFGFLNKVQDANSFFALSILIRFITAIGESAVAPSAVPLAGKQVRKENEGKAIAAAEAGFGVGTMFGPTFGGYLYDLGGFSLPFYVSGIMMMSVSFVSFLFLEVEPKTYEHLNDTRKITWVLIFKSPGVLVSSFTLAFSGIAWAWYSASLEPFLYTTYGLSSSQTGLVFMTFGLTYTVFTPFFGFLTDRGLDGLVTMIIGNLLIATGFLFLGPIPPLKCLGSNLWLTVVSIGLQGLGSAATYLGTLMYMLKGTQRAGLPDTEQTTGMVSSLWIVSDCAGGFIGSILGSAAFDTLGFEMGTMIIFCAMIITVIIVIGYYQQRKPIPSDSFTQELTSLLYKI